MNRSRGALFTALLCLAALGLAACGPGASNTGTSGGTVHILGTWTGSEQDSFLAMLKPLEQRTGIKVEYTGTRDLNAVLTTRVQAGNPPELVGLPGPGVLAQYAASGKLQPLENVVDLNQMKSQYAQQWITLGSTNGHLYGIFIKAALKGQIWYNTHTLSQVGLDPSNPPTKFDDMMSATTQAANSGKTPWCIGLENGAASGWPGTDWLEDIIMRQAGAQTYQDWYAGKVKWSDPKIRTAWETWGKIVTNPKMVYGGKNFVLSTAFSDAGNPMFSNPPHCYLHHQGSFITDFFVKANPSLKPVTDFNFFPFPQIDPANSGNIEIAGDLFGMFKANDAAKQVIKYLVTPEAQTIWVKRGGALSPNKSVSISAYPDELSKRAAQILVGAQTPLFDGSDMMPDAMNTAFFKGILDFVNNPNNLTAILTQLDKVQADSYK
jgi:alpha-glucoside transport system substrate-binding protein